MRLDVPGDPDADPARFPAGAGDAMTTADERRRAAQRALIEWHANDWLFEAVRKHHERHNKGPLIECRAAECREAVKRTEAE